MVQAFPSPLKDNNINNPYFKGSDDNNIKITMCHLRHSRGKSDASCVPSILQKIAETHLFWFHDAIFEMNLARTIFAQVVLPLAKVAAAKSRFSACSRTDGNITANSHQCTDMDQLNHN
jgi:hypothetical protein